jgi:hypothetical protein
MKSHPLKIIFTQEVHKLEYDPQAQYTFNFWAMLFWFWNMPLVLLALIFFNHWWIQISVFYIAEASVWALVATHFGAMSAAIAAKTSPSDAPLVVSQGPTGTITKEVRAHTKKN